MTLCPHIEFAFKVTFSNQLKYFDFKIICEFKKTYVLHVTDNASSVLWKKLISKYKRLIAIILH